MSKNFTHNIPLTKGKNAKPNTNAKVHSFKEGSFPKEAHEISDATNGDEKNNEDQYKPSGKRRLFVANLPNEMTEKEFLDLFKDCGELSDVFVSNKGFGFVKVANKVMAEKIKQDLDGLFLKNRHLRVRLATAGTSLKVLNLSPYATNETLAKAFSAFGPLDLAVVIADERGKTTGEGIVEFSRKATAQNAMKKINEGVFLVTGCNRPVVVEPYEIKDFDTGVFERNIVKSPEYLKEITQEPRFAQPGSFEYDYGNKWKALYQQEKIQRELLEKKILEDREALENDMETVLQEHKTMLLRQDLMMKQEELRRMEEAIQKNKEVKRDYYQGNAFNPFQQPSSYMNNQSINSNGASLFHKSFNNPPNDAFSMQQHHRSSGGGGGGPKMVNPHAMHPGGSSGSGSNKQLTPAGSSQHQKTSNKSSPAGGNAHQPSPKGGKGGQSGNIVKAGNLMSIDVLGNNSKKGGGGGGNQHLHQNPSSLMGMNAPGHSPLFNNSQNELGQLGIPSLMGPPVPPHAMMGGNMAAHNFMAGGGGGGMQHFQNNPNLIDPFQQAAASIFDGGMNNKRRRF